jgi:TolB-like protein/DNA-binding winged helix-turn-helix (wHTH) protein/Tfp pilus assembly protein PilF
MLRREETVRVRPKAMDVLCALAARPGEVVEREALLAEVWGHTAVTDEPLTATIGELRRLLGDRRGDARFIETIPKRGYRLLVAPRALEDPPASAAGAGAVPVIDTGATPPPATRKRPSRTAAIRLLALGILAVVLIYASVRLVRDPGAEINPESVAVLPFTVQSEDAADQYFGDGLAREIQTTLTGIEALQVASANSSFQFRDRRADHRAIRDALGVAAALDGEVRRMGDRIRIQVQLLDTRSGFNLWAETYDRQMDDVFSVQTEIAGAIAERLSIRLLDPGTLAARGHSADGVAYDLYLQATHQFEQARAETDLRAARSLFETAVGRDPTFALARIGIAETTTRLADLTFEPVEPAYARARQEVRAALEISPDLADGYWLLGWIALYHDWDWETALSMLQQALALQPGNSRILMANAAAHYHLNQLDRSISLAERACRFDPLRPGCHQNLAYFSFAHGDLDTAVAALARALDLAPDLPGAHLLRAQIELARGDLARARTAAELETHPVLSAMGRAMVAHAEGNTDAADRALDELEAQHAETAAYQIADVHAWRGDRDGAFLWLERALGQRDPGMAELLVDPILRPLRGDPAYADLARRLGFPAAAIDAARQSAEG